MTFDIFDMRKIEYRISIIDIFEISIFIENIDISQLPSLVQVCSCSNTGSIRDDSYWTSRENSFELIELSSINIV